MKNRRKMSKKSIALLTAAILLLLGGGITGTRAALTIFSQDYTAWFYTSHLQVHLMENGEDVCGGKNTLDGESKVTGAIATKLGYLSDENGETLGKAEPGMVYREELAAKNGQDVDVFARMTVRKYWVKTDENGNVVRDENGDPVKSTALSPDLIRLTYGPDEDGDARDLYNRDAWQINQDESTEESATYYCSKALAAGEESPLLFDRLMIDGKTAELGKVNETKVDGKTVFTYVYTYDGCAFYIEAELQGIQTHNAGDAIHSQWGVYNVEAEDDTLRVSD